MNAKASGSRLLVEATPSWQLEEADDPEDWDESFSFLKELDATLRCDVCYNIFTAPVSVRNCNHIFCSACIRSAINQPDPVGKHCPKCMEKDVYDSSLTAQPLIERTAEAWKVARAGLVKKQKLEKEGQRVSHPSPEVSQRRAKRSRTDSREESAELTIPRRSTRASSSRMSRVQEADSIVIDSDSDGDGIYHPHSDDRDGVTNGRNKQESKDYRSLEASDAVECPMCGRKVTLIVLNQHLDKGCEISDSISQSPSNGLTTSKWFKKPDKATQHKPRRRLPRPNYFEMKPPVIKQLLDEAGLSKSGTREIQTERHRQWVTLYNANLDASEKKQKSDAQLRRELAEWERGQEQSQRKAKKLNEEASRTYMLNNDDHFRDLLKTARESHMKNKEAHQKKKMEETNGNGLDDGEENMENSSSPNEMLESKDASSS